MTDLNQQTLGALLNAIASKSPTPGGGAVASITAALAAALAQMVLRFSQGKKSLAAHDELYTRSLTRFSQLAEEAVALAAADAEAYAALNALWKLDKDDPQRQAAWEPAVAAAISAPQEVMRVSLSMLEGLEELVGATNRMLSSDLAIAAVLAEAAVRAGAWNVKINLPLMPSQDQAATIQADVDSTLAQARAMCTRIEQGC